MRAFLVLIFGCIFTPMAVASICHQDPDFQHVELYDGTLGPSTGFVAAHEGAVGVVQWNDDIHDQFTNPGSVNNKRWCTGTLIAENIFITAGHCFHPDTIEGKGHTLPLNNTTGQRLSAEQMVRHMHISFGYQLTPTYGIRPQVEARVVELVDMQDADDDPFDYAILRLEGTPGDLFGYRFISRTIPNLGDPLTIIQHPQGGLKQVDGGGYFGRYDPQNPSIDQRFRDYMLHAVDTRGGSSGSGILNRFGELFAINTNTGCNDAGGKNIGLLVEDFWSLSPTLKEIMRPAHSVLYEEPVRAGSILGYSNVSSRPDYNAKLATGQRFCQDQGFSYYLGATDHGRYGTGHAYYKNGWRTYGGQSFYQMRNVRCSNQTKTYTSPTRNGSLLGYSTNSGASDYGARVSTADKFCQERGFSRMVETSQQSSYGAGHYYYNNGIWRSTGGNGFFQLTEIACSHDSRVFESPRVNGAILGYSVNASHSDFNAQHSTGRKYCQQNGYAHFVQSKDQSSYGTGHSYYKNGIWRTTGGNGFYVMNEIICRL